VFDNKVLRKIFGSKRGKVTREWRRLHREELYDLYSSPKYFWDDKIKKNEMCGACSTYDGEVRCTYRVSVGKPEGNITWKTQT
jgi:hypothetical protein